MNCRIIDLEQGSSEWLDFRKGKIGASMVASCVGIKGAFNTKEEVRDIILGVKEVYENEAMRKGKEYMILSKKIKSQVISTTLKCNFNSILAVKKNVPLQP